MTTAAFKNITPANLYQLGKDVRRIDVREPDEFTGPLGHLRDSELVPLATVERAAEGWPREQPLLLICRSGGRSATAANLLAAKGFRQLYNLAGGMMAVDESSPEVVRG